MTHQKPITKDGTVAPQQNDASCLSDCDGRVKKGPKNNKNPRQCIVTKQSLTDGAAALRFALAPDQTLTVDIQNNLPGRGAWITADRGILQQAIDKGAFKRAFKSNIKLLEIASDKNPTDAFSDHVDFLLKQYALRLLGRLQKQRALQLGFDAVKDGLKSAKSPLCIIAKDAGSDSQKIEKLASHIEHSQIFSFFSAQELGQAIGQLNAHYIGLKREQASLGFLNALHRWALFTQALDEKKELRFR